MLFRTRIDVRRNTLRYCALRASCLAKPGSSFDIVILGQRRCVMVKAQLLYDPKNVKLKG